MSIRYMINRSLSINHNPRPLIGSWISKFCWYKIPWIIKFIYSKNIQLWNCSFRSPLFPLNYTFKFLIRFIHCLRSLILRYSYFGEINASRRKPIQKYHNSNSFHLFIIFHIYYIYERWTTIYYCAVQLPLFSALSCTSYQFQNYIIIS